MGILYGSGSALYETFPVVPQLSGFWIHFRGLCGTGGYLRGFLLRFGRLWSYAEDCFLVPSDQGNPAHESNLAGAAGRAYLDSGHCYGCSNSDLYRCCSKML